HGRSPRRPAAPDRDDAGPLPAPDRARPRRRGHLHAVPSQGRHVRSRPRRPDGKQTVTPIAVMVASASETRATPLPPAAKAPTFFLPDFCSSPAVFAVVLIAELVALVIALARQALHDNFWTDLAGGSLFLLWVGLTCAAVLCRARPWLQTMPPPRAAMMAVGLLVATIGVVSEIVFQVGQFWGVESNTGEPSF